jgi:hypothetical protein
MKERAQDNTKTALASGLSDGANDMACEGPIVRALAHYKHFTISFYHTYSEAWMKQICNCGGCGKLINPLCPVLCVFVQEAFCGCREFLVFALRVREHSRLRQFRVLHHKFRG